MVIKNSIENLPRTLADGSMPPSKNPFVVHALAEHWEAWYEAQGLKTKSRAIPEAGPYRGSMASARCDRQLYYALRRELNPAPEFQLGYDPADGQRLVEEFAVALKQWEADYGETDPSDLSDYWTFWLGQLVHEALQPVVLAMYPGAAEAKHDLCAIGIPGSSHSDLSLHAPIDGHPTLIEIKSTNGFSYKMMATNFQGPATGPRYGAVLQAVMAAAAEGIDRVVVVLVSLERLSPNMAWAAGDEAARFLAEWHFSVAEMQPQLEAEVRRIKLMVEAAELGVLPARQLRDPEYPDGAVVNSPLAAKAPWSVVIDGTVRDTGTYWGCGYCKDRARCAADGA